MHSVGQSSDHIFNTQLGRSVPTTTFVPAPRAGDLHAHNNLHAPSSKLQSSITPAFALSGATSANALSAGALQNSMLPTYIYPQVPATNALSGSAVQRSILQMNSITVDDHEAQAGVHMPGHMLHNQAARVVSASSFIPASSNSDSRTCLSYGNALMPSSVIGGKCSNSKADAGCSQTIVNSGNVLVPGFNVYPTCDTNNQGVDGGLQIGNCIHEALAELQSTLSVMSTSSVSGQGRLPPARATGY